VSWACCLRLDLHMTHMVGQGGGIVDVAMFLFGWLVLFAFFHNVDLFFSFLQSDLVRMMWCYYLEYSMNDPLFLLLHISQSLERAQRTHKNLRSCHPSSSHPFIYLTLLGREYKTVQADRTNLFFRHRKRASRTKSKWRSKETPQEMQRSKL